MIEMKVKGLTLDPLTNVPIVILRELEGERALPIWVGIFEAHAIAREIENFQTPRPMTHDLLESVIRGLHGSLEKIIVSDLKDRTFYAKIVLRSNGESVEIDSRPSDAIALAVRARVPIFADENVLSKAGVLLDRDGEPAEPSGPQPVDPAELERMSAFKDFIESLDLDDFDKRKS